MSSAAPAATRFQAPARSIKLATYASRCIGNEILMYLRKSSNRRQEASIDEPLRQLPRVHTA